MILVSAFFVGFFFSLIVVLPFRFGFSWLVGRRSILKEIS